MDLLVCLAISFSFSVSFIFAMVKSISALSPGKEILKGCLPNGINVLLKKLPVSEYLIGLVGKGGDISSRRKGLPLGTAHMLEHVLIQQINPSQREAQNINGKTTHTHLSIYGYGTGKDSQKGLLNSLLSAVYTAPLDRSIRKELPRVAEEIERVEGTLSAKKEEFISDVYKNTPLDSTILGTQDSIQKITQKDLQSFMDSTFTAGNTLLVAVGNIDPAEIVRIAKSFPSLKEGTQIEKSYCMPSDGPSIGAPYLKISEREKKNHSTEMDGSRPSGRSESVLIGYKIPYTRSLKTYALYFAIAHSVQKYCLSKNIPLTVHLHYTEEGGLMYFSIPKNAYNTHSLEQIIDESTENMVEDIDGLAYKENNASLFEKFSISSYIFSIGGGTLTEEDLFNELKSLRREDMLEGAKIFKSTPYTKTVSILNR